jgi:hypothetical protein
MEMPRPTADHKRLEKLAGIWKGKETLYPSPWDPKGGEAQATTRSRVALSGFAVIGDYEQSRGGQRTFEGHAVFTWDPHQQQVVMHWFDCMGQGKEEFRGTWKGDSLEISSRNPMGYARLTYDLSTPGTMRSSMEVSQDQKTWTRFFEGTYTRAD